MTDEVSRLSEPGFGVDVLGDELNIVRSCWRPFAAVGDGWEETTGSDFAGCRCMFVGLDDAALVEDASSCGLSCVWIMVFTTSNGQVITPAMPPAVAPVSISRPSPISLLPTHFLAKSCSCS